MSKPNNSLQLIVTDHKMKCFAVKCQDQLGDLGNGIGLCESFPQMEIIVLLTHKDCAGIINRDGVVELYENVTELKAAQSIALFANTLF